MIASPYDNVPIKQKKRLQCNIPEKVFDNLFLELYPLRGTQQVVVSVFIEWLRKETLAADITTFDKFTYPKLDQILNKLR